MPQRLPITLKQIKESNTSQFIKENQKSLFFGQYLWIQNVLLLHLIDEVDLQIYLKRLLYQILACIVHRKI